MRSINLLIWPLVFISQLIAVSLLAWHLVAQVNFAYSTGYELLGLEKHIAEFAPLNRHKQGFEQTTKQEHWRLFAAISNSIQHNGEGLEEISYQPNNGQRIPLMHKAEIIHLQDVSHLINKFYWAGSIAAVVWIALLTIAFTQRMHFPEVKKILFGFCGATFITTTVILMIGATKVFYWFHTKIFPDGHQWFFYYEDSLMTTLMKAPDIFAFIATVLLSVLIVLWIASTLAMKKLLSFQTAPSISPAVKKRKSPAARHSSK